MMICEHLCLNVPSLICNIRVFYTCFYVIDNDGITASPFRRKGRYIRSFLILCYERYPKWESSNPVVMNYKWAETKKNSPYTFPATLSNDLNWSLALDRVSPKMGCCYTSNSPRIGGCNELLCMQI